MTDSTIKLSDRRIEDANAANLEKISEAVRNIEYGTVTIKIQDSRIVMIEKSEKVKI
ncbi:MAG: YezD family protein [Clostridiales Family XIII bacterium]|jgi:hypothetical protein|nr:YezD family protein [Clostridiales Family XIII bacterium]